MRVLRRERRLLRAARGRRPRRPTAPNSTSALAELRAVAQGRYREDIVEMLGEPDDAAAIGVGPTAAEPPHHFGATRRRDRAGDRRRRGRRRPTGVGAGARPAAARDRCRRPGALGVARPSPSLPSGYLATRAVVVRNSLRTGLGLALAVAITHVFPVQHGFWVVLGAMSVLRSSALTTGTRVVRAVVRHGHRVRARRGASSS